jgi:hypothetical protein
MFERWMMKRIIRKEIEAYARKSPDENPGERVVELFRLIRLQWEQTFYEENAATVAYNLEFPFNLAMRRIK